MNVDYKNVRVLKWTMASKMTASVET